MKYNCYIICAYRRSGVDIKAGERIKVLDDGFEDIDDYFSSSGKEVALTPYLTTH